MNNLLYNALMLGRNKQVANEEFLVAEGKKEPASFRILQDELYIEEVTEDLLVYLTMEQTAPGYLEIEVYCKEDCLVLERKILTSEDFEGGFFRYPIIIPAARVHNGLNYAQLLFRTSTQEIYLPVTINNKIKIGTGEDTLRKLLIELEENYLALRMNRMASEEWLRKDLKLLENIAGADKTSLFLMLYKAQLYIMQGTMEKANYIMDFVSEQLPKLVEPDYELSCYYLYIRSLYNMDDKQTEEAVDKVRIVHMRLASWKTLWMLFYMDWRYKDDPERQLAEIEALYERGCTSPEMYFEALDIYRARPNLIKNISDFELQVLNFAAKRRYFNSAIVDRLPELIGALGDKEKKAINIRLALKILKAFYKMDPSSSVLKAICSLVILSGDKSSQHHEYFKKAVREAFLIPGLYEYYVFTSDHRKMEAFPNKVIEYFEENADSLKEDRSYFYANIIANRYRQPDHYRACINRILAYAESRLEGGQVDDFMGNICQEILSNGLATRKLQQNLFPMLCTKKIVCKNNRMTSVLVFHNELNLYQDVFLGGGTAYVKMYSGSALVLFKDLTGNIYKNVEYEKVDLIDTNEYIDLCIKDMPINRYMLLEDTLPLLRAYRDPVEILRYLSKQLSTGLLRAEYEKKLMHDVVMNFSKNRDTEVYDELLEFRKFNLDEETKGRLIEVMVARTLYKQAFDAIGQYGYDYVSDEAVAKLAHVMVNLSNLEKADPLLLQMCETAFRKTAFDPDIFDYLVNFCEDDTALLIQLYRAASAYDKDAGSVAERILKRAVETKEHPDGTFYVFSKYYEKGEDEQLKDDYLTFRAIDYLQKDGQAQKEFFKFLENGFLQKKSYDVRVYVAYLYYMTTTATPGVTQKKVVESILKDLTRRGIMLEKFKELKYRYNLPATLSNSVIASRFMEEGGKTPIIRYSFAPKEKEDEPYEKEEEMSRIFDGCFAKYFTLFSGELIRYQIDDQPPVTVRYENLNLMPDGSRFSELDQIIKHKDDSEPEELKELARQYFIKDKLIDRIFNSEGR